MKIFLTGASGYIGGSVAHKLIQQGHQVYGLVRSSEKAELVAKSGVSPVLGSLDDTDQLIESAHNSDAVINTASSDHRPAVEALVKALAESGKTLIHTSGSSKGYVKARTVVSHCVRIIYPAFLSLTTRRGSNLNHSQR